MTYQWGATVRLSVILPQEPRSLSVPVTGALQTPAGYERAVWFTGITDHGSHVERWADVVLDLEGEWFWYVEASAEIQAVSGGVLQVRRRRWWSRRPNNSRDPLWREFEALAQMPALHEPSAADRRGS